MLSGRAAAGGIHWKVCRLLPVKTLHCCVGDKDFPASWSKFLQVEVRLKLLASGVNSQKVQFVSEKKYTFSRTIFLYIYICWRCVILASNLNCFHTQSSSIR